MRLGLLAVLVAVLASPEQTSAQQSLAVAYRPRAGDQLDANSHQQPGSFRVAPTSSRKAAAWKGAQIGFLVGALALGSYVYFSSGECHPDDPCFTPYYTALGLGVGGVVGGLGGAAIGAARWQPSRSASRAHRLTYAAADEGSCSTFVDTST